MVSVDCFMHCFGIKEGIRGAEGNQVVCWLSDCYLFQLPIPLPVPPVPGRQGWECCAPSVQEGGCSEALAAVRVCHASEIELEEDLP